MLQWASKFGSGHPRLTKTLKFTGYVVWVSGWGLLGWILAQVGATLSLAGLKDLVVSLQTVGAVIFGIVGAWVAIIYPRTIEAIELENLKVARKKGEFLNSVMRPLVVSAIVFIFSLLLLPTVAVLVESQMDYAGLRGIFFLTLVACTFLQIYAIVLSLRPVWDVGDLMKDRLSDRTFEKTLFPNAEEERSGTDK